MIETETGISVYKYKVEKNKTILFISLHIRFHLHGVENIHQYVFPKKYLMIYTTSTKLKFFERETGKLWINSILKR